MLGALLAAALTLISLSSARATTLVGPGLYREELVEVGRERDPETDRSFPFGAASALVGLEGSWDLERVVLTWVDDRLILRDPQTSLLYEVDPLTGEWSVVAKLHGANPGPEITDPDGDFDGDGVLNEVDPCPRQAETTEDRDGDGVGDLCDNCPDVANARIDEYQRPFYRTTTGGQPDSDADGIGDACDCDFAAESDVCNVTDLLRMLDVFGKDVESFDTCPDDDGDSSRCAPYDMDSGGSRINVSDLIRFLPVFGSAPEPCSVCPYQCSGPACSGVLNITAMTWDPVGGPVWNTPAELEAHPRLFATRGGVPGVRGLYAARIEGPRRFVLLPYAPTELIAYGLAFDPYPKQASETSRKTLYGVNPLGFYLVPIESLDEQVTQQIQTLPLSQMVDLAGGKPLTKLATPIDSQPIVSDDPRGCASAPLDLGVEACDPEQIGEAVFWVEDRCRPRSLCLDSVDLCPLDDPNATNCVTWFPDLDSCYDTQRSCAGYCSPFRLDGPEDCELGTEVSGFTWDGAGCVAFEACCSDADCDMAFDDPNECRAAFLQPRDAENDVFPAPPCPNFYHRPSCDPEAAADTCAPDDPRKADGFLWTGNRCEEVLDFCCEGEDCDDAFTAYLPLPPLIAGDSTLKEQQKIEQAWGEARFECFRRHLRCPGICDELSEVREGLRPDQCSADEVYINGYIWQFVEWPANIPGARRDCLLLQGCCRGPDCAEAATSDPNQPGTGNTKGQCLASFPPGCSGIEEDLVFVRSIFFENAGGVMGRLIGTDVDGNLVCVNPEFDPGNLELAPVSLTRVALPERHLAQVAMVGNFDVNADGEVDIEDVCEVETAVLTGAEPCRPLPASDPVAWACAGYPGGDCSATTDLTRDARVDEKDLGLIERRVGLHCDGSAVGP